MPLLFVIDKIGLLVTRHIFNIINVYASVSTIQLLGPIVQSVASPIADPGLVNLIQVVSSAFLEIDREIFSAVFLLLLLIQGGLMSVASESMCTKYCLTP